MKEQICGTCKYNKAWYHGFKEGKAQFTYTCNNSRSDICGLDTAYDDECDDWEGKE